MKFLAVVFSLYFILSSGKKMSAVNSTSKSKAKSKSKSGSMSQCVAGNYSDSYD